MESDDLEIPINLEVHPLGDNGEMEVLPSFEKTFLSSSKLPCGLPPVLPDTTSILNSLMQDFENLPLLDLDAVQKLLPIEPDVQSMYSINLCPLQTTLSVKRSMLTGKLLGFSEEVKDIFEGTYKTSTSLSRAPGPPDAGVKGSSSGFPFWPGGMDEPVTNLLQTGPINDFFGEELLSTPPGFEHGMEFEKKVYDQADYIRSQPQKIYLSDVLAMDDSMDLDNLEEKLQNDVIDLQKLKAQNDESLEADDPVLKMALLPVLKISEIKKPTPRYEWAVIEHVEKPVVNFEERCKKLPDWNFKLDNFQKLAILHLEKKESVFVAAHTSAGKTVVAEYAIELAKKNKARVIYTSPIKALSNQKFRDFKKLFGDKEVGLITGDTQKNQNAFCLIMTTEILRSMLYNGSEIIRELEWVIFDEVHYINDSERGVVWEEVFIMLPDHVNLIMLSATVPNTAEFAEWLGNIKKRKIYVISTTKRPVPLVYHLYTGSVGKSENELFKIVDEKGIFIEEGYNKALEAKKGRESKFKGSTGAKGPKNMITSSQEKNVYVGLLNYLKKNDLMPAVCFIFSRKRCNSQIDLLSNQDLVTNVEKARIRRFFDHSIKTSFSKEDRDLEQVQRMRKSLSRGFGVHHSGILPILKEIVELLVKENLVKILFATETFAMGVNMPAKTVVFDTTRKHDGSNFRDLLPSEFIQIAGRAGRRGLYDIGTVILLCKGDVPDVFSLKHMMLGKPTKLESQFKLTYSMILNLLKNKTIRVEDVMKRSFGESDKQKEQKKNQLSLDQMKSKLANVTKPECSLCDQDLLTSITTFKEIARLKREVMPSMCSTAISKKIFIPGRILVVSTKKSQNVPGVLLSVDKETKCKVLVISDASSTLESDIKPWSKQLYFPHNKKPEMVTVTPQDILVITNKTIRIQETEILRDCRQPETMKGKLSVISAFQDLCSLAEANLKGFESAILNIKDMDIMNKACSLKDLEVSSERYQCLKCPDISKHFRAFSEYQTLVDGVKAYEYKLSEESLSLHPEFKSRKSVLKSLEYIDNDENVLLKGSVAREMSNHELLITELLVKSTFNDCEPEEVAALLSCMVFQQRCNEELELSSHLKEKVVEITEAAKEISYKQFEVGIDESNFVDQYNFHLVNIVYEWAKGTTFAEIKKTTDIDEGIIVHSIRRLIELLKDIRNGAKLVGDPSLAQKMEDASNKIKRGIVFSESLYIKSDNVSV